MCGRTACTLGKCQISHACSVLGARDKYIPINWLSNINASLDYQPKYNLSPSTVSPVLVSNNHFPEGSTDRSLCGMRWGLVPHWKKDLENKSSDFKLSNCRAEGILSTTSFKTPLVKGQRCVIIADGFYEWQTLKDSKQKQPYFIYIKDKDRTCKVSERKWGSELEENVTDWWDEDNGWVGPRLLTMAGLFDINRNLSQDEPIYTYSVITVAAHESFSHIHHRMPAILVNNEEVTDWLDNANVSMEQALSLLRPTDILDCYPVSSLVGNSRNNTAECLTPISASTTGPTSTTRASKSLLQAAKGTTPITKWFSSTPKYENSPSKRAKLE